MLSKQEQIQRLQDCIALLHDVDAMQQVALGDCDVSMDNHITIHSLIADFEDDIADIENPAP